jgi:hypothetical protein
MKVSHEVPIAYLEASNWFNDYDYCLPHLLDLYPDYEKYFREAKQKGRYIIMDNSLHELGEAYNTKRLIYWVNELKPNEFIIPDVWEDAIKSMRNAKEWLRVELPDGVKKVAVVQGKSFSEAVKCYHTYKLLGYEKIAFSYGADYYHTEMCPHPNRDIGKALGRLLVISKMLELKAINRSDEIHLLGCSVPQEFLYYKGIEQIKTIDTSNPIMAAFDGTLYNDWGLLEKPKTKIDDVIGDKTNFQVYQKIEHNVETFRKINNL